MKFIPLRALFVEDNPDDAVLMERQLRAAGFNTTWHRVETEPEFVAALDADPEVILCDNSLPDFDSFRALTILRDRNAITPLIIVSGTIGEEVAVAAMNAGAADYVLKDRPARLGRAVTNALDMARVERERGIAEQAERDAQARFRDIFENAVEGIYRVKLDGRYVVVNRSFASMLGYDSPEAFLLACSDEANRPIDDATRQDQIRLLLKDEVVRNMEVRARRRDGSPALLMENLRLIRDERGEPSGIEGMSIEITDREPRRDYRPVSTTPGNETVDIAYVWEVSRGPIEHVATHVSPQLVELLGFPASEWASDLMLWSRCLHPADRDNVLTAFARCIELSEPIDINYRMISKNGRVVWLHDHAEVAALDRHDRVTTFRGVQIDITSSMAARDREHAGFTAGLRGVAAQLDAALGELEAIGTGNLGGDLEPRISIVRSIIVASSSRLTDLLLGASLSAPGDPGTETGPSRSGDDVKGP